MIKNTKDALRLVNDNKWTQELIDFIKETLIKMDNLELAFALLRQHIRLSNIRGECSLTMNGISHKYISKELYESLLEIFYEIKVD